MRCRGSYPNLVVAQFDTDQLVDPRDVDEVVEMRQAHRQHRDQALPAREDLRVVAVLGKQRDGLVDGVGPVIRERGSLHDTSRDSAANRSSEERRFRLRPNRKPITPPAASAASAGANRLAIGTATTFRRPTESPAVGWLAAVMVSVVGAVVAAEPPRMSASSALANCAIRLPATSPSTPRPN